LWWWSLSSHSLPRCDGHEKFRPFVRPTPDEKKLRLQSLAKANGSIHTSLSLPIGKYSFRLLIEVHTVIMPRGSKRKHTDAAAADAPQTSTPQPAKRVKKEDESNAAASASSSKQDRKEPLSSSSIEDGTKSSQTIEKKERSKKGVKKDEKLNVEATNNPEPEPFMCKHEGHFAEQCWQLHPEQRPDSIEKKAAHMERKKKRKEKKKAKLEELQVEKEAKLAAREAAIAAGVPSKKVKKLIPLSKERPNGEKYQTKKMRRLAKEAAKAAAGLAVQVVVNGGKDQAEDNDVDEEMEIEEKAPTSARQKALSPAAPRQTWSSSQPGGGRFLTHDPIFSLDEA
jgi:hypothetical protein